jgi:hypothetical protein
MPKAWLADESRRYCPGLSTRSLCQSARGIGVAVVSAVQYDSAESETGHDDDASGSDPADILQWGFSSVSRRV